MSDGSCVRSHKKADKWDGRQDSADTRWPAQKWIQDAGRSTHDPASGCAQRRCALSRQERSITGPEAAAPKAKGGNDAHLATARAEQLALELGRLVAARVAEVPQRTRILQNEKASHAIIRSESEAEKIRGQQSNAWIAGGGSQRESEAGSEDDPRTRQARCSEPKANFPMKSFNQKRNAAETNGKEAGPETACAARR